MIAMRANSICWQGCEIFKHCREPVNNIKYDEGQEEDHKANVVDGLRVPEVVLRLAVGVVHEGVHRSRLALGIERMNRGVSLNLHLLHRHHEQ